MSINISIDAKLALLACSADGVMTAGILSSTATPSAPSMTTAIVGVRVFDGVRTIPQANVVIADGKIVSVGSSLPPAGAAVVDGDGKTLLPGLIDAHAHVFGDALARALAFGVTTERDMFTDAAFASRMRDEQSSKRVVNRADLRTAGILATAPGGHGTEYGIKIPTVTGAADADRFVAARVTEGSDYIKIVLDDGAPYGRPIPTIDQPTLKALVEAAHRWGRMAVVHIGSYRGARRAIEAGADGLAHLFADETPETDFGALMARKHAFVISTLSVLPRRSTTRGKFAVPACRSSPDRTRPMVERRTGRGCSASFGSWSTRVWPPRKRWPLQRQFPRASLA